MRVQRKYYSVNTASSAKFLDVVKAKAKPGTAIKYVLTTED